MKYQCDKPSCYFCQAMHELELRAIPKPNVIIIRDNPPIVYRYKTWTKDDIEFMKANDAYFTLRQMAKKLKKSASSICEFRRSIGMPAKPRPYGLVYHKKAS